MPTQRSSGTSIRAIPTFIIATVTSTSASGGVAALLGRSLSSPGPLASPLTVRTSFQQMLEHLREGLPIGQALALAVADEAFCVGDRQTHGEVLHRVVRSALTPGAWRRRLAGDIAVPLGDLVDQLHRISSRLLLDYGFRHPGHVRLRGHAALPCCSLRSSATSPAKRIALSIALSTPLTFAGSSSCSVRR